MFVRVGVLQISKKCFLNINKSVSERKRSTASPIINGARFNPAHPCKLVSCPVVPGLGGAEVWPGATVKKKIEQRAEV